MASLSNIEADENTSLLENNENQSSKKKAASGEVLPTKKSYTYFNWLVVFCLVSLMIGLICYLVIDDSSSSSSSSSSTSTFTAKNEYGVFGESYAFYGQYEMVEPHIHTTLTAEPEKDISDDEEIMWEIETSSGVYEYPVGTAVVVSFNSTGKLAVKWCTVKTSSSSSTTTSLSSFKTKLSKTKSNFKKKVSQLVEYIIPSWTPSDETRGNGGSSKKQMLEFNGFVGPKAPQMKSYNLAQTDSASSHVFGIYVRREIRNLTASDRDAFFDACEIVFRLTTSEGQALYGSKYYSGGYYGDKHNVLSGNADCDHLHDGLGFLPGHLALTLMFEQTLQAINPRVSIPYWDYTIDMTNYELSGELSSFFDSVVFGSDYFGSATTNIATGDDDLVEDGLVNPSGRVLTGRFTQVEVSLDYWDMTSTVYNGYGHIRSPWNNNNDPYVNRFNTTYGFSAVGNGVSSRRRLNDLWDNRMKEKDEKEARVNLLTNDVELKNSNNVIENDREVKYNVKDNLNGVKRFFISVSEYVSTVSNSFKTSSIVNKRSKKKDRKLSGDWLEFGSVDCASIFNVMQYDSWYDFGKKIEYQPHGPVHTLIGGTHGADYRSAITSRADVSASFVEAWALLAFGLFKDMWRAGKVSCPSSCSADTPLKDCKCYCPMIEQWTVNSSYANQILINIDPAIFSHDLFTKDNNGDDISIIVLKTLCNDYDELTPVIGESLQSSSPLDVSFWPIHPFIEKLAHWKLIYSPFKTTAWGPHGEDVNSTCYGHSKTDKLGWKNLWDEDDYEYTNIEILEKFDPTVTDIEDYAMNYIYDDFTWNQCTEFGFAANLY